MKCKNCGTRFNEKVSFCTVCGASMEESKSGSSKTIIISVAATLAVCIAAFLIWNVFSGEDETEETAATSEATTAAVATTQAYSETQPIQTQPATQAYSYDSGSGEYVIPDSDTRYLSESEVAYMTADQLRYARNEIYARHGRLFNSDDLQAYFSGKSWYRGTIMPDDFSEDMLSKVEKHNVQVIKAEEDARGL